MNHKLGAHEVLEVHEVLSEGINMINNLQLYRPHVQDAKLAQILDHQLAFVNDEYNLMVQALNGQGRVDAVPYRAPKNFQPQYGLRNPGPLAPNQSMNQLNDQDISCAMLSLHKSGAAFKMIGALECSDPDLRRIMQQSAINCAEMAYEVWQYMNQNGYYQVPTMKEVTTQNMIQAYQPSQGAMMGMNAMHMGGMGMNNMHNTMNTNAMRSPNTMNTMHGMNNHMHQ
ncbi:spore coat protein [Paenibacillus turpanensis]|uniref:spore coat protein n=1 Tax=Paenibacillus turpanensis TaxID=2689078 RepID=UPI00140D12E9|nr:spore coat protein [Paenibacillus turpanensis]